MRRRAVVAAIVVVACLAPIVASAVHVGRGWLPTSDTAIIATRARDVLGPDQPLLGQPSTAGATVGTQVHHPGPLEFWAIAAGQQAADVPIVSLVVVAAVNAAAVLTVLWWVRALTGSVGLALAALPVLVTLWSLRGEALVDPLNPAAAVLPFAALLVSLVAVGRGMRWALVSAAVAGSWAAQAHLTVTGLVAVAVLATAAAAVVRRVRRPSATATARLAGDRLPVVVAAAALLVCWAGPLVDAALADGGNVRALLTAGGAVEAQPGGLGAAVDRTVRALTWRPVWAQAGADVPHLLVPPSTGDRALVAVAWSVGLAAAVANRRRAPALGWAFALASVVLGAGTLLLSRLPGSFFNVFQPGNYLWLWPAGALLWSAALGGVAVAVAGRLPERSAAARGATPAALLLAVAVAVAAVAVPSHRVVQRHGPVQVRALADQLAASLDRGSTYGIDLSFDLTEQVVDVGLLHELERRGFTLRVDEAFAPSFGSVRATGFDEVDAVLEVALGRTRPRPPAGATVVATYEPPEALLRRLHRAEAAVAARIDRLGGPGALLYPELGVAVPSTSIALVRGDFLGLAEIGLLSPAVAAWPEVRALATARAQPVRRAGVHLLPPP